MSTTYLIAAERYDGWTKIGFTGHTAEARLRTLQTGSSQRLRVVGTWPDDVEGFLHRHFAPLRGSGEWFALPAALLADVAQSTVHARGFIGLIVRWPVDRIVALGPPGVSLEDLADTFAVGRPARTRRHLASVDRPLTASSGVVA